ncbi:MAG: hypothetical protein FWD51_06930 [Betaproteobacteria bacterium]|nr:hypothetical protein [Betaproteobacteria bacterium]
MLKQITKAFLLLAWLIIGTFLYAVIVIRLLDIGYGTYLPPFPEFPVKIALYFFPNQLGAEDFKDIHLFGGALLHVSIYTLIAFVCFYTYKHFRNKSR